MDILTPDEIAKIIREYAKRGSVEFLHVNRSYWEELSPLIAAAQYQKDIKARLDRPEREKIYGWLYEEMEGLRPTHAKGWADEVTGDICALFPTEEEISAEEKEKLIEWGEQQCEHTGFGEDVKMRRFCPSCWQTLKDTP